MTSRGERVSAVIPTRLRPNLLLRAIASAQAQTLPPVEIIAVIDGPDPETEAALAERSDARVRAIVLPRNSGPAVARNVGAQSATGDWIAFLDDDDEWHPQKLERQIAVARECTARWPIVSCQVRALTPRGAGIWPTRPPGEAEHISDYLMDRATLLGRPGYIATSSIMVARDLLLEEPMPDEEDHEDWAWLLRATARPGVRIAYAWEPLCTVRVEPDLGTRSRRDHWRVSFRWCDEYAAFLTRRAYAAFLMTKVAGQAKRQGQWQAILPILRAVRRRGWPSLRHYAVFVGTWLLPVRGVRFFNAFSLVSRR